MPLATPFIQRKIVKTLGIATPERGAVPRPEGVRSPSLLGIDPGSFLARGDALTSLKGFSTTVAKTITGTVSAASKGEKKRRKKLGPSGNLSGTTSFSPSILGG